MTSLADVMVERRMLDVQETDDGFTVQLKEGVCDFVAQHPVLTTMAAGYLINKVASGTPKTIDVATNTFKFFAKNANERKLQKELIDTLVATKHYSILKTYVENGVTTWVLRRLAR